jgi:hypothetical protein
MRTKVCEDSFPESFRNRTYRLVQDWLIKLRKKRCTEYYIEREMKKTQTRKKKATPLFASFFECSVVQTLVLQRGSELQNNTKNNEHRCVTKE